MFPLIQGLLAFDTPLNGLARSMFVYGAFSNYQKVSNVFNVMTALSAAAPATISKLATKKIAGTSAKSAARAVSGSSRAASRSKAWKTWQMVAVRTGTVGAIAAGGVAAYVHRKEIIEALKGARNLKKEDVVQGYKQSVDALGQGLAYVNRGNVGESFAWLSDHFTFVGALLKQNEMNRRLERLASLKGVGVRDIYASLGENGSWSGGYFVPERTFCAIPSPKDQEAASKLFSRHVVEDVEDEIAAHMGMFKPEKNKDYERMTSDTAKLVVEWFNSEEEIWDDPKFAELPPAEAPETEVLAKAVDEGEAAAAGDEKIPVTGGIATHGEKDDLEDDEIIPDESPIDIAAAASLVPLPDDKDGGDGGSELSDQKQAYLQHLFGIAQQTSTNLRSYLPSKLPQVSVPEMPKVSMPNVTMPSMPSIPSMPSGLGGMGSLFSRSKSSNGGSEDTPAASSETKGVPEDTETETGTGLTAAADAAAASKVEGSGIDKDAQSKKEEGEKKDNTPATTGSASATTVPDTETETGTGLAAAAKPADASGAYDKESASSAAIPDMETETGTGLPSQAAEEADKDKEKN